MYFCQIADHQTIHKPKHWQRDIIIASVLFTHEYLSLPPTTIFNTRNTFMSLVCISTERIPYDCGIDAWRLTLMQHNISIYDTHIVTHDIMVPLFAIRSDTSTRIILSSDQQPKHISKLNFFVTYFFVNNILIVINARQIKRNEHVCVKHSLIGF